MLCRGIDSPSRQPAAKRRGLPYSAHQLLNYVRKQYPQELNSKVEPGNFNAGSADALVRTRVRSTQVLRKIESQVIVRAPRSMRARTPALPGPGLTILRSVEHSHIDFLSRGCC